MQPAFLRSALGSVGALVAITLTKGGGKGAPQQSWYMDLADTGTVGCGTAPAPAVRLELADADFAALVRGAASSQKLFLAGKLKVRGDMARAMKVDALLQAARKDAAADAPPPKAKL